MKVVALTGSIGCGKTTLAHLLRKRGQLVFDADCWTKQIYQKKEFQQKILETFPQVNKNGLIDKKQLRILVFDDKSQRKKLETLIYPYLKKKLRECLHKNCFYGGIIFIDAALIFEWGWDRYCDSVILADVAYDIQKQRVMTRDGVSAEEFEKIIQAQMPRNDKICRADVIIDTNKSLQALDLELISIVSEL